MGATIDLHPVRQTSAARLYFRPTSTFHMVSEQQALAGGLFPPQKMKETNGILGWCVLLMSAPCLRGHISKLKWFCHCFSHIWPKKDMFLSLNTMSLCFNLLHLYFICELVFIQNQCLCICVRSGLISNLCFSFQMWLVLTFFYNSPGYFSL